MCVIVGLTTVDKLAVLFYIDYVEDRDYLVRHADNNSWSTSRGWPYYAVKMRPQPRNVINGNFTMEPHQSEIQYGGSKWKKEIRLKMCKMQCTQFCGSGPEYGNLQSCHFKCSSWRPWTADTQYIIVNISSDWMLVGVVVGRGLGAPPQGMFSVFGVLNGAYFVHF